MRAVKKEQLLLLCVVHPFEPKYREREVKNGSDQKQAITLQCSPRHKAAQWGPLMCKVEAGRDGEGEREREAESAACHSAAFSIQARIKDNIFD